jgi:hypothetical protein
MKDNEAEARKRANKELGASTGWYVKSVELAVNNDGDAIA